MKLGFFNLITMENIKVSIPSFTHFSIGTSPYYAHQHALAIDIYQNLSLENYEVFSPVSGKVLKTKKLLAPKARFKGGIDNDYITLIQNSDNPDLVFKILHVKLNLQAGEQIEIGDTIGTTIRNGYFAYWSSPHLHLEIRKIDDPIRARGAVAFPLNLGNSKQQNQQILNNTEKIFLQIISIFPEFILARLAQNFYHNIGKIYGVRGFIDKYNCILDGGIPHYKHGVIITENMSNITSNSPIFLMGHKLGYVQEFHDNFGIFNFERINLSLNNKKIRGISLYLANTIPMIKIIPYDINGFLINPKSSYYLTIN